MAARRRGAPASGTIVLEQYALSVATPDELWLLVGNPRRLPEWTDADEVSEVDPEPPAPGGRFVTRVGRNRAEWTVNNFEPYLFEAVTAVSDGRLGIGVRVLADRSGSRLVLAGAYRPAGRAARLRFQLVGCRRLRARFDRWSAAALRLAARSP